MDGQEKPESPIPVSCPLPACPLHHGLSFASMLLPINLKSGFSAWPPHWCIRVAGPLYQQRKGFACLSKSNRSPDALRHTVVNCTKKTAAHSTARWLLAHRERKTHAPPASGHLNTCFAQPSTYLVHSDLGLCRGHTKKDIVLDSDECIALGGNGRSINLSLDHSVPSHTLRSV